MRFALPCRKMSHALGPAVSFSGTLHRTSKDNDKKKMFILIAVLSIMIGWPGTVLAQSTREQPISPRPTTAVSPLIERYMLDELKALRTELSEAQINIVR
jgi:hypothetical protein